MQNQKRLLEGGKDLTRLLVGSTRKQDRGFTTVFDRQDDLMAAFRSQEKRIQGQADLLNRMLDTLKATPLRTFHEPNSITHLECEHSIDGSRTPRGRSPSPGTSQQQEASRQRLRDLLQALDFNIIADTAAKDASTLQHMVDNLSSGSQHRVVALITSPVMQEWMTSTVSRQLVVNGHMYSSEEEIRQSPLSFFCAKLVDSIPPRTSSQPAASRGIFAVRWFCGQHTNFHDYGPDLTDYDAHPPVRHFSELLPTLFLPKFVLSRRLTRKSSRVC